MGYAQVNYQDLGYKKHKKMSPHRKKKRQTRFIRRAVTIQKKSITPAEKMLKDKLLEIGAVFTFQKDIQHDNKFKIADFYFPRGNKTPLIVEVDGGYHYTEEQQEKDSKRTEFLKKATGCELIRFENEDVLTNVDMVVNAIKAHHILIQIQT